MKDAGYVIAVLFIVTGCIFTAGCATTAPAPQPLASGTPVVAAATDAGFRIITEESPPFNFAGADGKAAGVATDVVQGILTRLNQTAVIEILPWSEGYAFARAGPRVALYSTARTAERENLFKWVGPIASNDFTFYGKNGTRLNINSLEAAKKAGRIGVVKDDVRYQFLQENRFTNITPCGSNAGCLRDLMAGTTDLWLGSSMNAAEIARSTGIDLSAVRALYEVRTVPLYIAFSPDTPDAVITRWQGALDTMKRDGTFEALQNANRIAPAAGAGTVMSDSAGTMADLALDTMIAQTDGKLKAVLRPYQVLAGTSEVQSGNWQNIRPLLATLEGKEPDVLTWYARPDGSYYTVADGLTSASLKNRSYFPVVLAGKESVGTVVVSFATGRNAGIVAVPVKNQSAVTGVLGSSVYLDTLTVTLRDEIPAPFVFYAIDSGGAFALHSDKAQISRNVSQIGKETSFGRALALIRSQDAGMTEYDDGGFHYTARFRSSPLTGWRFVAAWPQSPGGTTGMA